MEIGLIGLGKMGGRIAGRLINDGFKVVAWNRSDGAVLELKAKVKGLKTADTIESLIKTLNPPRIIWIMVPHAAVEEVLTDVGKYVSKGDVVIDGGNSFYKDTQRRFNELEKAGIHFLGIGVSGGILAEKNGFPFMVGGSRKGYDLITPILDSLSKPNGGHEYLGTGGAGHFVKMVHNGIEYGMMQSIGEGFDVLNNSKYKLDLSKVSSIWQKGTIISGFLIDRAADALKKDRNLSSFTGPISRSGEGDWTIQAAKEEGLDIEVIDESVEYRRKSETDVKIQKSFTAKMVNALRNAFGGHEVKK